MAASAITLCILLLASGVRDSLPSPMLDSSLISNAQKTVGGALDLITDTVENSTSGVVQDSVIPLVTGAATSALTSLVDEAEKQVKVVESVADGVAKAGTGFTDMVADAAGSAASDLTNTVTALAADVTDLIDVSSCLALEVTLEQSITDIAATAIASINEAQAELLAKCEDILAALQKLITLAKDQLAKLESCGSNIANFLACIPLVIPSMQDLVSSIWITILAEISSLTGEFNIFDISFATTEVATVLVKIDEATEQSVTQVMGCLTALTTVVPSIEI